MNSGIDLKAGNIHERMSIPRDTTHHFDSSTHRWQGVNGFLSDIDFPQRYFQSGGGQFWGLTSFSLIHWPPRMICQICVCAHSHLQRGPENARCSSDRWLCCRTCVWINWFVRSVVRATWWGMDFKNSKEKQTLVLTSWNSLLALVIPADRLSRPMNGKWPKQVPYIWPLRTFATVTLSIQNIFPIG